MARRDTRKELGLLLAQAAGLGTELPERLRALYAAGMPLRLRSPSPLEEPGAVVAVVGVVGGGRAA
jgi:hypothetical protein